MSSSSERLLKIGCAVLLLVACASIVRADPTDADREQAKTLYIEGMELRDKGNHKAALAKFKAAYKLVSSPITALAVAVAYEASGDLLSAETAYEVAAKLPPKANESTEAKTARDQAIKRGKALHSRIPRVRIVVSGVPTTADVKITIDGEAVHSDGLVSTARVNPGTHTIVVSTDAETRSKDASVDEGETADVEMKFDESPAPAAAETRTNPLLYVGGGVFVVGSVVWVASYINYEDLNRVFAQCQNQPCRDDYGPKRSTAKTMTYVGAVSALLGAGFALWGYAHPLPVVSPSATLRLRIGLGTVALEGSF